MIAESSMFRNTDNSKVSVGLKPTYLIHLKRQDKRSISSLVCTFLKLEKWLPVNSFDLHLEHWAPMRQIQL